ncbi:MAG TPA: hypothetical protein PLY21_11695 [Spirochaetota bacterium]|nr:hypothetical protein [Spirochaetota bacterium]
MINRKYTEGLILSAIILSLLHLFINEYAVFARWSVASVNTLLFAGIIFDLIFSVEFTVKSIKAAGRKNFIAYMQHRNGWVDLISSLPVLLLYSLPFFYLFLSESSHAGASEQLPVVILNLMAVIRMPLLLRSLRVLKLSGIIRLNSSEMTRHHASVTGAMAVVTTAVIIMLWSGITGFSGPDDFKKRGSDYSRMLVELESAATLNNMNFRDLCENILISDHRIIKVNYNDGKSYEKLSVSEFRKYYSPGDYIKIPGNLCFLTVSCRDLKGENALLNMLGLLVMLALAFVFMLLYSRHFERTVSDIAGALNSGFRKKDFNLMIKIRDEYREEELYRLARFYNDAYLPAKLRKRDAVKEGSGTPLTMDAVKGFAEKTD